MTRTKAQNKQLYGLLSKLGINADTKEMLVLEYTEGRTCKSSEMEYRECNNLIASLQAELKKRNRQKADLLQTQRRNVFKLMYDIGFIDGRMTTRKKMAVINAWIENKTAFKTDLNNLSFEQLTKLIKQLQAVRRIYNERTEFQAKYN